MADDLHPETIRARTFATSRRGFDRTEVEAFQDQVAGRVAELEEALEALQDRLGQLGITDLADLKEEFDTVGEDVREILQAARDAAEDMRQRAAADADEWRNAAEADVAALQDEAQRQAEAMRGEAWEASAAMLEEAKAAAAAASAKANEEVLFVRAEAEREALRLTGDAKRDSEEAMRAAQIEAEKLVETATQDSEATRAAAQQSADLAHERVRALEERREELLAELEQTRETLAELEDRIEGRRDQLTHATTDPAESAVRVITEDDPTKPDIGDWLDEDATVRLVPRDEQMPPPIPIGLVDADDLVAEVESLRSSPPPVGELVTGGSGSSAESASLDFEITSGDVAAVADAAATAELVATPAEPDAVDSEPVVVTEPEPVEPEPEPEPVEPEPEPEPVEPEPEPEPVEPEPEPEPVEPEPEPELESESEPERGPAPELEDVRTVEVDDAEGGIDDLFASLRKSPEDAADVVDDAAEAQPVEPEPAEAMSDESPQAESLPEVTADAAVSGSADPWEMRDRSLMPVTNEVLRSVKRQIVDVQNAVLEELRTEPEGWRPKRAMFDQVLDDTAAAVASKSYRAGVSAAGELTDRPPPDLGDLSTHDLVSLATDLWEAVADAIDATAGGTSRERGASVGRIFRAWRTDEAERRVRQVAHAEYNAGVAAGLDSLGLSHIIEPTGRDIADPDAVVIPAT